MAEGALRREVAIINRLGMHARAAAKFVTLASRYQSEVTVCRNGREVNGKSIMGVMMLAAGQGATIEILVDGPDAEDALDALEALIEGRFDEPE